MSLFGVYVALAVLCVILLFILVIPKFLGPPKMKRRSDEERRRHSERRDPHRLSHSDFRDTHNRREHY